MIAIDQTGLQFSGVAVFRQGSREDGEGFAKECAVVTHYRLKTNPDGSGVIVDPEAKLEEELIVRPISP